MLKGESTKKYLAIIKKILLFFSILIFAFPLFLIGIFYFYEKELDSSTSPKNINKIKIVEKGMTVGFGSSTVRIKSGWSYIDRKIYNDGGTLTSANVSITWEDDYKATIKLFGDEQIPEIIKFNAESDNPFMEGQYELGSFSFKVSESPNLINIIELREISKSKGPSPYAILKIFYGKRGSPLHEYIEYTPTDNIFPDDFKIKWTNDEQVTIEIVKEDAMGEAYIEDTIELDLSNP
ncbi:hypothetical protein V1503_24245 [Bacillus sp. SCS-151]|uniref:hypothetical protein n=1 Tax=Nanhaiella sioensis TaxID=3115293 RepID=UPI00397E2FA5